MICYLAFLNWCETSFFWHLLLLLLIFKKCSLNHKAIMCEEAKRTSPGRGKKWSICKFTPEANQQVAVLLYSKVFIFRWQYQQIFPMGRIFLGRGLGVMIWNDLWIPGKIPNLLSALSKKYTLYICLVVTSDYLRVSNHAIMFLGMTTFFSYSKLPFLLINQSQNFATPLLSNWLKFHLQMYATL